MLAAADLSADCTRDVDRGRVSDEALLQTICHDLAAVYTEVLRVPIPDSVATILSLLEARFQPSPDLR